MQDIVNSILSETVSGYHQVSDGEKQQFLNRKTDKVISAFADAGYITPEQVAKTQELVNQMANLANDIAKGPVTILPSMDEPLLIDASDKRLMTGADWYARFKKEMDGTSAGHEAQAMNWAQWHYVWGAAQRAAGIDT